VREGKDDYKEWRRRLPPEHLILPRKLPSLTSVTGPGPLCDLAPCPISNCPVMVRKSLPLMPYIRPVLGYFEYVEGSSRTHQGQKSLALASSCIGLDVVDGCMVIFLTKVNSQRKPRCRPVIRIIRQ